mmetsp:Transcript_8516/g.14131  ORF Transcript_8516/g.14131 Transcript_8516/m.14131 type:complete len:181 (+) Transcript_8516:373-915(+)
MADIKGAVAAIHFMVTNAAKFDLDEKSLVLEIQQLGLPKENAEAVGKQYREAKEHLRNQFAEDSYRVSKLAGVDWRVDHILASSAALEESMEGRGNENEIEDVSAPNSLIHVKLQVSQQVSVANGEYATNVGEDATASGSEASNVNMIRNIAFEMSPEKLDVLIHELSTAQDIMQGLDST